MKSFFRKIRHKTITRKLVIPKNASILDTSCQDGGFLSILMKNNEGKNINIFGIDISSTDVEAAKKIIPTGIFKITDNSSIPFGDKTFNTVVSSLTLHHMSQPVKSFNEMKRVLKDDGSIYLIDIISENTVFNFILKHIKCPEPYHFEKFYSLKDLNELLTKTKLKISQKVKILTFPTPSVVTPVLLVELKKD
ncbi:MAG: class I SAM-dependent methyltransferase [Candidatus Paceibacterota bacterium]|jgi:ubiquinone/menaquinone biosynthesis C-methylase UbiE